MRLIRKQHSIWMLDHLILSPVGLISVIAVVAIATIAYEAMYETLSILLDFILESVLNTPRDLSRLLTGPIGAFLGRRFLGTCLAECALSIRSQLPPSWLTGTTLVTYWLFTIPFLMFPLLMAVDSRDANQAELQLVIMALNMWVVWVVSSKCYEHLCAIQSSISRVALKGTGRPEDGAQLP